MASATSDPATDAGPPVHIGPWDGYLAGPENALAQAAAVALARGEPGSSPLVIVGPSGSGKTRLLEGLAAERMARRPDAPIALLTAEAFADACHEAAASPGPDAWPELRGRFRGLDLLALDDLRGMMRSPLAASELLATLDALDRGDAGVVVSAREAPEPRVGWPPGLVDRLLGGLVVRLDPPGGATRRRFLLERARSRSIRLSSDAVDALVDAADGFRTLDGWLARLALAARVERRPIDRAMIEAVLDGDDAITPVPSPALVARAVAARFRVRLRDLRGPSRHAAIVEPRHLAILLARELTGDSFAALGAYFGGRDTKTIRHACRAAADRLARDPAAASLADALRHALNGR